MKTSYDTKQQAIDDGWISARHWLIEQIGPWNLMSIDISGPNEFGYYFGIQLRYREFPHEGPDIPSELLNKNLAYSQTIWLKDELNQLRRPGAFTVMFRSEDVDRAIEIARAAVPADWSPPVYSPAEQLKCCNNPEIQRMLQAMVVAAAQGNPAVTMSKRTELPYFTCNHHPELGAHGIYESAEHGYLVTDPEIAMLQMERAGIQW